MSKLYTSLKGMVVLMLMLYGGVGFGQPGTLDVSFGNAGIATMAFNSLSPYSSAIAIQNDGKMVLCGGIDSVNAIGRFNANGSIDSSFGVNGRFTFKATGSKNCFSNSIAIQPDGKIVLGGSVEYITSQYITAFFLARLNPNGALDSTFGSNGIVINDFTGNFSRIKQILLTTNDKILVGGYKVNVNNQGLTFCIGKYKTDGSLDSSFGIAGFAQIDHGAHGYDIKFTSQGKILIGGDMLSISQGHASNFGLVQINQNGFVDSTFGTNGLVETDFADTSEGARLLAVQSDDKIILAGDVQVGSTYENFGLVRYKSNGMVDSSFGLNGKVIDSLHGYVSAIHILNNGQILVTGNSKNGGKFKIAAYNSDGTITTNFGTNGIVLTTLPGSGGGSSDSKMQADGKLVVAGISTINSKNNFIVARYSLSTFPLNLLTFTAKRANNTNLLNWTTAQEVNADRFEIERSSNGKEFSKIGIVSSQLSAGSIHKYSYTDNSPLTTAHSLYYRLKMLDRDGQFTYSPIRQLTINHSTLSIAIFPNPAKDNLQLQLESDKQKTINLQVVSQDGKVVLSNQVIVLQGASLQNININKLVSGHYFLKVIGEKTVLKFEKL